MLSAVKAPGRPCCTFHAASLAALPDSSGETLAVSSLRVGAFLGGADAPKGAADAREDDGACAAAAPLGAAAAREDDGASAALAPPGADALLELGNFSQVAGVVDDIGATSFCLPGGG